MNKLLGFKYTEKSGLFVYEFEKYFTKYIILEHKGNQLFINQYSNGKVKQFDITNTVDIFLERLKSIDIEQWNGKTYSPMMEFFGAPFNVWRLDIETKDFKVMCSGQDNYPLNWLEFKHAVNQMGAIITD